MNSSRTKQVIACLLTGTLVLCAVPAAYAQGAAGGAAGPSSVGGGGAAGPSSVGGGGAAGAPGVGVATGPSSLGAAGVPPVNPGSEMPINPGGPPSMGGARSAPVDPAAGTMEGAVPDAQDLPSGDQAVPSSAPPPVQVLQGGGTGEMQNPAGRVLRGGGIAATPAVE